MNNYILWQDMLLFYGTLPKQIILHKHPVIQLVIGVDGPFLKKGKDNAWHETNYLLVAPNVAHECDGSGKKIFSLNIDPESSMGEYILDQYIQNAEFSNLTGKELEYFDFGRIESLIDTENHMDLRQYIHSFFAMKEPQKINEVKKDERIQKIKDYIVKNIHEKFSTQELCELVFLSESRLLHLFKEQIGLPIRNYILWMRLKKVIELMAKGESLTYAAHEAGFSDSAHLSNIFSQSIGINPSLIIKNSKFIQVFAPDLA